MLDFLGPVVVYLLCMSVHVITMDVGTYGIS